MGTPRELTNNAGDIVWAATYKAWGATASIEHPPTQQTLQVGNTVQMQWVQPLAEQAPEQNLRFQGQYFDAETGLHYNRFRYYDPECGRFICQDPIGVTGGINLYLYARNPVNFIDPFGLNGTNVGCKCDCKTLAEWLKDHPDLLQQTRDEFKRAPQWQGIDPDKTPVFYRTQDEVKEIRKKAGERDGHHPHGLALGGPEGQKLTQTNETVKCKNPDHSKATGLQRRIINVIKGLL